MIIYAVVTIPHGLDEYIRSYFLEKSDAQTLIETLPDDEWEYSYVKEIKVE